MNKNNGKENNNYSIETDIGLDNDFYIDFDKWNFEKPKKIKEYFSDKKENMPLWLTNHIKGNNINIKDVFSNRTMFYPGACTDGNPLGLLNNALYCHTFIYIDNGIQKENIKSLLSAQNAFTGYNLYDLQEISRKELLPNGFKKHYHPTKKYIENIKEWEKTTSSDSFCLVAIYERKEEYDDNHGAKRFALIYIGADAVKVYDALFVNKIYHVPNCVFLSPNFGGYTGNFYHGHPLEKVALMCDSLPDYILLTSCQVWDGFEKINNLQPAFHDKREVYLYINSKTNNFL